MRKSLIVIFAALAAGLSCSRDDSLMDVPVRISPVETRAGSLSFSNGDMIGLNIVKAGAPYALNAPLTYSDGVFSGYQNWYRDKENSADLLAYYPYDSKGMPAEFVVREDQSGEGFTASDFMVAMRKGVSPTRDAVRMPFRHVLSRISFNVAVDAGTAVEQLGISRLKMGAAISPEDGSVLSVLDIGGKIRAHAEGTAGVFSVIVPPQEASLQVEMVLSGGGREMVVLENCILESGKEYKVNIDLRSGATKSGDGAIQTL